MVRPAMTDRTKVTISALCLPVALGLGLAVRWTRSWDSPNQRAIRLCRECDLAAAETQGLVEAMRGAPATREVKLAEFYATFPDRAAAEPRKPCAEAVLDAAGNG